MTKPKDTSANAGKTRKPRTSKTEAATVAEASVMALEAAAKLPPRIDAPPAVYVPPGRPLLREYDRGTLEALNARYSPLGIALMLGAIWGYAMASVAQSELRRVVSRWPTI